MCAGKNLTDIALFSLMSPQHCIIMHCFPACLHSFSQFCQSCGLPSAIQMFCMVLRWETSFCTAPADVSTSFWIILSIVYILRHSCNKMSIPTEALILWNVDGCITETFLLDETLKQLCSAQKYLGWTGNKARTASSNSRWTDGIGEGCVKCQRKPSYTGISTLINCWTLYCSG